MFVKPVSKRIFLIRGVRFGQDLSSNIASILKDTYNEKQKSSQSQKSASIYGEKAGMEKRLCLPNREIHAQKQSVYRLSCSARRRQNGAWNWDSPFAVKDLRLLIKLFFKENWY